VVNVKGRALAALGQEAFEAQDLSALVSVHCGEGQRRAAAVGDLVWVLV